ncbi:putative rRNA-processing protein ebp2 [Smittium mucronatum]|uniref:Putative rRNA-processing protein ebp2 n=1 Tax=Smittium mucronatum TaxID=133383 RepID=A0A1R0GPV0_9FUNG|nr:putative rRNA-processing protein ebp2 [Smittium mucronatum]
MSDSEDWSDYEIEQDDKELNSHQLAAKSDSDYDSEEEREAELELAALKSIREGKTIKEITFENDAISALIKEINPESLPWIERCSITSSTPITLQDVTNDIEIELAIYQQALEAAQEGKKMVLKSNHSFTRPDDYFAEMVKTDEDMEKIRSRLLQEHKSIQLSEEAKKQRELKKFGKKVQNEKLRERIDKKRQTLNNIELLKKKRKSSDNADSFNDDFDVAIGEDYTGTATSNNSKSNKKNGKPLPNPKRRAKNDRYGHGGSKRGVKRNTQDSISDVSGINQNKGRSGFGKRGKGPASSKAGKKPRLGKSRRMSSK